MSDKSVCGINYFCVGAFLIFLGSILLCALGFTVVLPHQATRHWPYVTCNVTKASYHAGICSCRELAMNDRNCLNRYPCLQIHVVYRYRPSPQGRSRLRLSPDNSTSNMYNNRSSGDTYYLGDHNLTTSTTAAQNHTEGLLKMGFKEVTAGEFIIPAKLYRAWSDAFHERCAISECGAEEWNVKETERFKKDWGQVGSYHGCYYDPANLSHAIIYKTPLSSMVHAVVWSSGCLVAGCILWLGLCLGFWKMESSDKEAT